MKSIFIELKLDEATSNFQKSKESWKKGILDEKNKVVHLNMVWSWVSSTLRQFWGGSYVELDRRGLCRIVQKEDLLNGHITFLYLIFYYLTSLWIFENISFYHLIISNLSSIKVYHPPLPHPDTLQKVLLFWPGKFKVNVRLNLPICKG